MGVSESSSEGKTLKIKVIDFILKHPDLKPKRIAEKRALEDKTTATQKQSEPAETT